MIATMAIVTVRRLATHRRNFLRIVALNLAVCVPLAAAARDPLSELDLYLLERPEKEVKIGVIRISEALNGSQPPVFADELLLAIARQPVAVSARARALRPWLATCAESRAGAVAALRQLWSTDPAGFASGALLVRDEAERRAAERGFDRLSEPNLLPFALAPRMPCDAEDLDHLAILLDHSERRWTGWWQWQQAAAASIAWRGGGDLEAISGALLGSQGGNVLHGYAIIDAMNKRLPSNLVPVADYPFSAFGGYARAFLLEAYDDTHEGGPWGHGEIPEVAPHLALFALAWYASEPAAAERARELMAERPSYDDRARSGLDYAMLDLTLRLRPATVAAWGIQGWLAELAVADDPGLSLPAICLLATTDAERDRSALAERAAAALDAAAIRDAALALRCCVALGAKAAVERFVLRPEVADDPAGPLLRWLIGVAQGDTPAFPEDAYRALSRSRLRIPATALMQAWAVDLGPHLRSLRDPRVLAGRSSGGDSRRLLTVPEPHVMREIDWFELELLGALDRIEYLGTER